MPDLAQVRIYSGANRKFAQTNNLSLFPFSSLNSQLWPKFISSSRRLFESQQQLTRSKNTYKKKVKRTYCRGHQAWWRHRQSDREDQLSISAWAWGLWSSPPHSRTHNSPQPHLHNPSPSLTRTWSSPLNLHLLLMIYFFFFSLPIYISSCHANPNPNPTCCFCFVFQLNSASIRSRAPKIKSIKEGRDHQKGMWVANKISLWELWNWCFLLEVTHTVIPQNPTSTKKRTQERDSPFIGQWWWLKPNWDQPERKRKSESRGNQRSIQKMDLNDRESKKQKRESGVTWVL